MMTVDNVVFMHLNGHLRDATFSVYLRELEASLANRTANARVAVVYDLPTFSSLHAMGAREGGAILKRHDAKVRQTTACLAVVTQSTLARAAVQTVLAVSGLAFPNGVFGSLGSALAYAARHLPALDAASVEHRIREALLATRARRTG